MHRSLSHTLSLSPCGEHILGTSSPCEETAPAKANARLTAAAFGRDTLAVIFGGAIERIGVKVPSESHLVRQHNVYAYAVQLSLFGKVCSAWRSAAQEPALWKQLCELDAGLAPVTPVTDWKSLYIRVRTRTLMYHVPEVATPELRSICYDEVQQQFAGADIEFKTMSVGSLPQGINPLTLPGLVLEHGLDSVDLIERPKRENWRTRVELVFDNADASEHLHPNPNQKQLNQNIKGLLGQAYAMRSVENTWTGDRAPLDLGFDDIASVVEGIALLQRTYFDPTPSI